MNILSFRLALLESPLEPFDLEECLSVIFCLAYYINYDTDNFGSSFGILFMLSSRNPALESVLLLSSIWFTILSQSFLYCSTGEWLVEEISWDVFMLEVDGSFRSRISGSSFAWYVSSLISCLDYYLSIVFWILCKSLLLLSFSSPFRDIGEAGSDLRR